MVTGICDWGPTPQPETGKLWTMFSFVSWVIIWTLEYSKRRLICKTWWNVAVTWTPRNKNSCLAEKAKWHFSHLCAPLEVQAQCSYFIILLPISVQTLELWIPQTTEIVVLKFWIQQQIQVTVLQKDFSLMGTLLFLIYCFACYQGSLWI